MTAPEQTPGPARLKGGVTDAGKRNTPGRPVSTNRNDCNRYFADLLPADFLAWEKESGQTPSNLPGILNARDFTRTPLEVPPEIVRGVLHAGSKLVFGGPSKAFKSWTLMDLCMAVAAGDPWLDMPTAAGPVLYVNFELQPFAVHHRLKVLAQARRIDVPENLHVWNLRGHSCPIKQLIPELEDLGAGMPFSLIVPDPIYKTLQGRDENSAGDIAAVCDEIERLTVETGAAVAFGAHYAKGNAASKQPIDRISGSGVWARDPDAILTATAHEEEAAFTLDMTLRNFAPVAPFVIRWEFPRMIRDASLDPQRLKQPARPTRGTRPPIEEFQDKAEALLKDKPLAAPIFRAKLQRLVETRDRARDLAALLVAEGRIVEHHDRGPGKHEAWFATPKNIGEVKQQRLANV